MHNNRQINAPDLRTYVDLTKLGLVWTLSLSILSFMLGSFGYSLWWHGKREDARLAGYDLDKWAEDFALNHDPVAKWLVKVGLQRKG